MPVLPITYPADLGGLDVPVTTTADETDPATGVVQTGTGYYIGAGTGSVVTSYPGVGTATALAVYQSIANTVRILKGQGVRFRIYSDSRLVA